MLGTARGGQWWPDGDFERRHINPEQEARFEADAWEEPIVAYLAGKTRVRVGEVGERAIHLELKRIGTEEQRRITKILKRLGWTPIKDSRGRGYVAPIP